MTQLFDHHQPNGLTGFAPPHRNDSREQIRGGMIVNKIRGAERTRQNILDAAIQEFSEKGFKGARIVAIAQRAKTNYQALYYHFGNKEALYSAALESTITGPGNLDRFEIPIDEIGPVSSLARLIDGVFDAFYENLQSINLLADENMHKAKHFDQMPAATQRIRDVVRVTAKILKIGEMQGVFRAGLDPIQVYMMIAGLATSYMTNIHLNSKVFSMDLLSRQQIEIWRNNVKDIVVSGVRP